MLPMFAIYKKELRSYFIGATGYVYTGIFLALSALLLCYTTLQAKTYKTSEYFTLMIFALVILLPLLTMRLFAEERKTRTEQLLLTAPLTITGMVLGKYFAAFTIFLGTILFSCINFFPLFAIGREELRAAYPGAKDLSRYPHIGPVAGQIFGSLIGLLLIGATFLAVGLFISALTESQLSAAVTTIATILVMVTSGLLTQITDSEGQYLINSYAVRFVLNWFSVLSRYSAFSYGYFDFAALVYYLSITAVFLFLTVRVYDKRRWA
ncbi:MAG TPA: ABC transporter permease [Clostridiales bacterium]|nr:ABC transporter permease [Clostridiales bacterium]